MYNINPFYSGKISIKKDVFGFIDESGDDGFNFSKNNGGPTKWLTVSSFITNYSELQRMSEVIDKYKNNWNKKSFSRMTFKNINHNQKVFIFNELKKYNYLTINSCFYKPLIDPNDRMTTYPSMYFVGLKNILERATWLTKQYNKRRIHLLISTRTKIKKDELRQYLFKNSIAANKNLTYLDKVGVVKLCSEDKYGLILADYSASSLRTAIEEVGEEKIIDNSYYNIFLKGRFYKSKHQNYPGIWSNGLKCTPNKKSLIKKSGILEGGTHKTY